MREPIVLVSVRTERVFGLLQCHYQSRILSDERINFRFARVRTPQLLGIAHWALRPYGPPFHFGTLDQLIAIVATFWEIEDAAQVILRPSVQSFNFSCMGLEDVAHRKRCDLF